MDADEKDMADEYDAARKKFVAEGLRPAIEFAKNGNEAELAETAKKARPLFKQAVSINQNLLYSQINGAEEEYKVATKGYTQGVIANSSIAVIGILFALFSTTYIRRIIIRKLDYLESRLDSVSKGNLNTTIKFGGDEFDTVLTMLRAMQAKLGYSAYERQEIDHVAAEQHRTVLARVASDFEKNVLGIVEGVSNTSRSVGSAAEFLTETAKQTSERAMAVASAAEEASSNVQTVAAASEELSVSITEIAQQVARATERAGEAVNEATQTNAQVRELADSAQKIGDVIRLISEIASQTNLLALNATIEAARAGEAGKGFAVVASEVKHLATQTAKATDEISVQIGGIQKATGEVVTTIQHITHSIESIAQLQASIAAAVEEQGAATREISRNVQEASAGTSEVSQNIGDVTQGAQQTGEAAGTMQMSAEELTQQAHSLRVEVDKFLKSVRE